MIDTHAERFDREHIWHPYSSLTTPLPALPVASARGITITLADGTELLDGMASWWSAIHGYNHPTLNKAVSDQLQSMSHMMFGGLTHEPAITLCRTLAAITPAGLDKVFLSDSGSVAVEVAMKMALQYWQALGRSSKSRFVALRGGYHGDTFAAMSVCDPITGMHHLFADALPKQFFAPRPSCRYGQRCDDADIESLAALLRQHNNTIAAVIAEPIVQGAGGMYFYSADYLARMAELCHAHDVLLVLDEIATGFGRTGKMFACEHADVTPDILCVGKAMTGGYLSQAATLTRSEIASTLCGGEAGAFMHGPTFMGNPLASAVSSASIELLLADDWQANIARIENALRSALAPAVQHADADDVRVLGAIGVIEAKQAIDMHKVQALIPELGVWLRPFGKLIYTMPPYITSDAEIARIGAAMIEVLERCRQ